MVFDDQNKHKLYKKLDLEARGAYWKIKKNTACTKFKTTQLILELQEQQKCTDSKFIDNLCLTRSGSTRANGW